MLALEGEMYKQSRVLNGVSIFPWRDFCDKDALKEKARIASRDLSPF